MLFIKNHQNIYTPAGIEVSEHAIDLLRFLLGREGENAIARIGTHTLLDIDHPAFERLFECLEEMEEEERREEMPESLHDIWLRTDTLLGEERISNKKRR